MSKTARVYFVVLQRTISQGISPPCLDHSPVYQGGVTFSETEEKCLISSPLTLTGVLKALIRGEDVERIKKRKRATSEM